MLYGIAMKGGANPLPPATTALRRQEVAHLYALPDLTDGEREMLDRWCLDGNASLIFRCRIVETEPMIEAAGATQQPRETQHDPHL